MSRFLEFCHLKPYETVKLGIVTLNMTFERIFKDLKGFLRILKDFKVSYSSKTQVCQIAFAQVPRISQLYKMLLCELYAHYLTLSKKCNMLSTTFKKVLCVFVCLSTPVDNLFRYMEKNRFLNNMLVLWDS